MFDRFLNTPLLNSNFLLFIIIVRHSLDKLIMSFRTLEFSSGNSTVESIYNKMTKNTLHCNVSEQLFGKPLEADTQVFFILTGYSFRS